MENTLQIAIVAASSAIVGAIVPSLMSYLNQRAAVRDNRKENNRKLQTEKYEYFILAMQNMMNNSSNSNCFANFQNAVNQILIYADNDTAVIINEYYRRMIELQQQNAGLNSERHKKYQGEIINSIRKNIGVSNKKLDDVYLIAFDPIKP